MHSVGIDLGTTFSAIAHLDDRGKPAMLPNREGDVLTASAVYLTGTGDAVVGAPALDLKLERPELVATHIKRRMGYPDYGPTVAGRTFRPETLSAVILRKLLQDAEAQIGPITRAVITVPAYFDDTRRQATIDAGRIAGLKHVDIFDEPSAAALAYLLPGGASIANTAPQTVLVYDLGGGTFDVTFVKLGPKRFQTLAIEGDVFLGGKDWDDALVNHVAEQFQQQHGGDPRTDPQSLAMLQSSAERAKRTLSKVDPASITCAHDGRKMTVPISRSEFEGLTGFLLQRTRFTAQDVLKQAGLTWPQVDRILMVGGSTHMPMTGRMLRELTGKEPERSLAVSEVVARGAAIHAGILAAKVQMARPVGRSAPLDDIVEIRVNAHSLGVEIRQNERRINNKLINKHTQLPASASRVYHTVQANQTRVRVRVLQGEAQQAESCIPVGECWIDGLPANLPKGSPIEVTYGLADDGRISVTAKELTGGISAHTELHRPTGLSEAEIATEAAWLNGLVIQ
jgi:molecular chaperone DnaK